MEHGGAGEDCQPDNRVVSSAIRTRGDALASTQGLYMIPTQPQFREIKVDFDRARGDSNRFAASLSSEAPVERVWGIEVLKHDEKAVDLGRAKDGFPLLMNHDSRDIVGKVENVRLAGGVLRGELVFFSTPKGVEARTMVSEGHRSLSIGYQIIETEHTGMGSEATAIAVTRWMPLEVSIVAVPADVSVGVGRALPSFGKAPRIMETKTGNTSGDDSRVRSIVELGEQYAKYLRTGDVADAVRNSMSVEQFQELILTRMESRHTDTRESPIGMTPKEVQRYSLGRALVAMITNDWSKAGFEREASRAAERVYGLSPEGIFVPHEVWGRRDFNVGTSSEAGNLVPTLSRVDQFTDVLRNKLVFGALGARFLPNLTANVDIPRKSVASTLGMLTEIGSASETNPNVQKATLSPKRAAAYVEVSKQALIQSALALENMIRDDLVQGAAVLIEDQALNGAGTGANVRGIRNTTGIGTATAGANGAAPAWSHFIDLETACANSNAEPGAIAGYVTNSKVRAKAKVTARGTNLPEILPPDAVIGADGLVRVNGYPFAVTNNIPSNLTKGTSTTICSAALFAADWSNLVLGFFGAPDVVVDPYTLAATGQVRITLNQFFDAAVRQPAAFAKMEDLLAG